MENCVGTGTKDSADILLEIEQAIELKNAFLRKIMPSALPCLSQGHAGTIINDPWNVHGNLVSPMCSAEKQTPKSKQLSRLLIEVDDVLKGPLSSVDIINENNVQALQLSTVSSSDVQQIDLRKEANTVPVIDVIDDNHAAAVPFIKGEDKSRTEVTQQQKDIVTDDLVSPFANGMNQGYTNLSTGEQNAMRDDANKDVINIWKESNGLVSKNTNGMNHYSDMPKGQQNVRKDDNNDADIWQDALFSMGVYSSVQGEDVEDSQVEGCEHDYIFKENIGRVCGNCGLVGQSIANTFDFPSIIKNARKRMAKLLKRQPKRRRHPVSAFANVQPATDEEDTPALLELHPMLEKKMHPHQIDGFKFLCKNLVGDNGGCILAHAPGTGKTFLVISFLQSFMAKNPKCQPLIIAPKIMLKPWQKEFQKWEVEKVVTYNLNEDGRSQLDYEDSNNASEALKSSRLKTLQEWCQTGGVLLLSYTLFASLAYNGLGPNSTLVDKKICDILLNAGLLIIDEAHFPRTEKTKILEALSEFHTVRRILLSGTLFQNNFKELFNILKLCRPNFMADWFDCLEFDTPNEEATKVLRQMRTKEERQMFMEQIADKFIDLSKYVTKPGQNEPDLDGMQVAMDKLRSLTLPFIHWHAGDVLSSLPGLVEFSVLLNLTEAQESVLTLLQGEGTGRGSALEYDIRLAALCIHPSLFKPSARVHDDGVMPASMSDDPNDGIKTTFIFDLLEFCSRSRDKERILIFSEKLAPFGLLETMFLRIYGWNKGVDFLRLDGDMNEVERQRIIDEFNSEDASAHVLLASLKACGEGICLTGASRVIILDVSWNPAAVRQAVSRAFRIGQKRIVYVYRLIANQRKQLKKYASSIWKDWMSKSLLDRKVKLMNYQDMFPGPVNNQSGDRFMDMVIDRRKKDIAGVYKHTAF